MGRSFSRTAAASCLVAMALMAAAAGGADARELTRSEVNAIARDEARRAVRSRAQPNAAVPTDMLRVGPQGQPMTRSGNGTTVVPNR